VDDDRPVSRAERSRSFGAFADEYDRFRPGPAPAAVDWLLPPTASTVVDLGAGTGALTRLLVARLPEVYAVEPDERMRAVLAERVPSARVVEGRGEAIPLESRSVDAALASSSWHWMDPAATVAEVARVLRPGGVLGVLWSGPQWSSGWLAGITPASLLERLGQPNIGQPPRPVGGPPASRSSRSDRRRLVLPGGAPFAEPEHNEVRWAVPMTMDELVGLLGTYSGVITASPERRDELFALARSYLRDETGLAEGEVVQMPYRAVCWKAVRSSG
jgi:SAM-dependent methyltransferase